MKVSNHQKSKGHGGVSRETLNRWQRKDAVRPKCKPTDTDEKEDSDPLHGEGATLDLPVKRGDLAKDD